MIGFSRREIKYPAGKFKIPAGNLKMLLKIGFSRREIKYPAGKFRIPRCRLGVLDRLLRSGSIPTDNARIYRGNPRN
jgi:hypothetical protein